MMIQTRPFFTLPDGRAALLYELTNHSGMTVAVSDYGCAIVRLLVPDRDGKPADIVLGHESAERYRDNPGYHGALVGRNCGRIQSATVFLDGVEHHLEANNNGHNLHTGRNGLTFTLFHAEVRSIGNQPMLLFSHTVEDGEDGFPGKLTVNIAYLLTDDNTLMIDYRAVSDRETVINFTNHSYFNLAGHDGGSIGGHTLQLDTPFYCPNTADCLPTGEILSVENTPFDLRQGRELGELLMSEFGQVALFGGFDHNFILDGSGYREVGKLYHPGSGRMMELLTDRPCVQVYTANKLNLAGKQGAHYGAHSAVCLETQSAPNAARMPWLASPIYRAGEEFVSTTAFRFSVE